MKRLVSLVYLIAAVSTMLFMSGCADSRPRNEVETPEDARGLDIGALYGSPSARLAEEFGTLRAFYTGEDLMNALTAGAVECVFMESTAAAALAANTARVRILQEPLLEYDLRFAIARENNELLEAVDTALLALTANGTLRGLRDKYFASRNYVYSPPDVPLHPGSLTLAVPPSVFPYSYWAQTGEFTGFDVEVARAVCDYLGVEMQILEVEVGELVTAVWFGRADFALGWLPGDVGGRVNISDPYAFSYHSIIVRR